MASIAELLIERGRQSANARQRQGELSNQIWQGLANRVAQTGQQLQQERVEAPIRAQEAQMRGLQIQNLQGQVSDRQAAEAHDKAFRDAIVQGAPDDILVKMDPERAEKFINGRDAIVKAKQGAYANKQGLLRDVTLGINAVPDDLKPDAWTQKRKELIDNGLITEKDAPVQFDKDWFQSTLHYAQQLPKPEPYTLKPGEQRFGADNKPIASVPAEAPKPSAEQDTQRAVDIRMRLGMNQSVSPADRAWLKSHEAEKTLGVDLTAGMASNRQATAIAAQTAQQARAQNFTEQQQGRKELTEKVEQPYQTAQASAQTLRDVVAAAKQGNKIAGALQSLETTMSAIRAQGLNRINTAEIGVTGDAGSLWDRIVGRVGKLDAGQPVPPDLQKDMQQFASILEKAAYKKYQDGHASITTRYKLTDEKPLPGPTIYARDPQGVLHSAPYGKPIPKGWTEE